MKTKHHPVLSAPLTQSGDRTQSSSIRRNWFALAFSGFLFTSIFALAPSPAQAQCKRWDVSGQWVLQQDNGINVQVNMQQGEWQQTSANLTGTATLIAQGAQPQPGGISGNITDFAFAMKLTTGSGIYRFTGKIGRGGKMEGTDNKGVHWIATSRMKCADATPEPIGSPTPRRPRS